MFHVEPVVVLASGPSLDQEDIDKVRHLKCIAVNNTWERVRHCDVLFAGDHKWWMVYGMRVDIPAKRVSLSYNSEREYSATRFKSKAAQRGGYNSGCVAIEYAISHGASQIILLGFDCSIKNGLHHHGPHEKSANPTEKKCYLWQQQFKNLRNIYPDADIVNCSSYTELTVFPRKSLDAVLAESALHDDCQAASV